jgi:arylsulfatase A-like enzyme
MICVTIIITLTLGKVPTVDGFKAQSFYASKSTYLRSDNHDWTKPLEEGPGDMGFDTSYMSAGGIQNPPYSFYRNDMLETNIEDVTIWTKGSHSQPMGESYIKTAGEGDAAWDSSAYNMILVNETVSFLDEHIVNKPDEPFFAYVALGAVHIPHSPPDFYLDGVTPVAGEYPNSHLDVLNEIDMVVGSLIEALDDRLLLEDTIVVFTSDNGGLGKRHANSAEYGHLSNGLLRGSKGQIWEGGTRIPMMLRWDNSNGAIAKGETRDGLVGLNDLYITLCDLADIDVPNDQAIDSLSFARHLKNENWQGREYLGAWTYDAKNGLEYESIRKNEMKLIRQYVTQTYQLYNLTEDISESFDVSAGNEDLVEEMVTELKSFGPCYDNVGNFRVGFKANGKPIRKTCAWFATKKTRMRCLKWPLGQDFCRLTCAIANKKLC